MNNTADLPEPLELPLPIETATEILTAIASGSTTEKAITKAKIASSSWYGMLARAPELLRLYRIAREQQAEALLDRLQAINDLVDEETVQSSRLKSDNLKWLISKLAPKQYGDKQQLEVTGQLAIIPVINVAPSVQVIDVTDGEHN